MLLSIVRQLKLVEFSYLGYHNNEWALLGIVDKSESWQFGKRVRELQAEPVTIFGENKRKNYYIYPDTPLYPRQRGCYN